MTIVNVYSVSVLYVELGLGADYLYKGVTDCQGIHTHATLALNPQEKTIYRHTVASPSDTFLRII